MVTSSNYAMFNTTFEKLGIILQSFQENVKSKCWQDRQTNRQQSMHCKNKNSCYL